MRAKVHCLGLKPPLSQSCSESAPISRKAPASPGVGKAPVRLRRTHPQGRRSEPVHLLGGSSPRSVDRAWCALTPQEETRWTPFQGGRILLTKHRVFVDAPPPFYSLVPPPSPQVQHLPGTLLSPRVAPSFGSVSPTPAPHHRSSRSHTPALTFVQYHYNHPYSSLPVRTTLRTALRP